jgi:ankyrin repeat protein
MDPIARAQVDAISTTPESTPLHAAARAGNVPAIELLVSEGARSLLDGYASNPVDTAKFM